MDKQAVQIVWFKRDLRVRDHLPLYRAALRGPVVPLYIVEPGLIQSPDFGPAHWTFIAACLGELRDNLEHVGQTLVIRIGEAVAVFEALARYVNIDAIWTHHETGNDHAQRRNQRVAGWAGAQNVAIHNLTQHGAMGDGDAADWDTAWDDFMNAAPVPVPQMLKVVNLVPGRIPDARQLRLGRDADGGAQPGGESTAAALVDGFLSGESPAEPDVDLFETPLDRITPFLAYGAISSRTLFQKIKGARQVWRALTPEQKAERGSDWRRSLTHWDKRLRQRAWYRAQLRARPDLIRASALPEFDFHFPGSELHLEAWRSGSTGYPLIDASLAALRETGWLPPALARLATTFAVFDLGLPWVKVTWQLGQLRLDYDPDVHFPQTQADIGAAAPSATVVDPVRLGRRLDPTGQFLRRWLPALAHLPEAYLHAPWTLPMWERDALDLKLGRDYPAPLISHAPAARRTRQKLGAIWGPAGQNGHVPAAPTPSQLPLPL